MRRFFHLLRSNWISWAGAMLTTLAFMAFVTSWIYLSMHGSSHGAYAGLFLFVVVPGLFLTGLVMMPLGWLLYRRQMKERLLRVEEKPVRLVRLIVLLTLVNFTVVGTGGYEALHYMDSQQFCGTLCHKVMSPTYEAYIDSPHARVACVECHIGPGASWFVKAKISGLRQVLAVMFDTYQKPIPTPVHDLRPARDTCEQCHWPEKFSGDRMVVRRRYENDEASTMTTTALVLKTGGVRPDGKATGIHWHVHKDNQVTYIAADDRRRDIPWVKFKGKDGKERVFVAEGVDRANPPKGEMRTMDCLDCHNQPSHSFQDPENALDDAITAGSISRELPFVRKVGIEALRMGWTRDNVGDGIKKHLTDFYTKTGALTAAQQQLVAAASDALAAIWRRNIHPDMAITWGTYPQFQGHVSMDDKPTGCFRCHDGLHEDEEGESISADCGTCHTMLADRDKDPDVLKKFGLEDQ